MRTTLYALQKESFESNYRYLQFPISRSQWESLRASVANSSDVAEILAEHGDDLAWSGDSLLLSGAAAIVLFEMCLAQCQTAAFQVSGCDFFFADLAADRMPLDSLSVRAQTAWDAFISAVDTAGICRSGLPFWLDHAARYRCAYTGLLTPAVAAQICECRSEIQKGLAQSGWVGVQEDASGLLDLVVTAARENCWVLGWEPGT